MGKIKIINNHTELNRRLRVRRFKVKRNYKDSIFRVNAKIKMYKDYQIKMYS